MSISTAPRDLAAIKHALELGLILATLIIATAAHEGARKLTPEINTGQGGATMFTPALAMLTWRIQFNHLTCIWQERSEREI
jgi:hypothetical protein